MQGEIIYEDNRGQVIYFLYRAARTLWFADWRRVYYAAALTFDFLASKEALRFHLADMKMFVISAVNAFAAKLLRIRVAKIYLEKMLGEKLPGEWYNGELAKYAHFFRGINIATLDATFIDLFAFSRQICAGNEIILELFDSYLLRNSIADDVKFNAAFQMCANLTIAFAYFWSKK